MNYELSHDSIDETPEAKGRWFRSLNMSERMDMLCWFTDLILENNPSILEMKDVEPVEGRICVLEAK